MSTAPLRMVRSRQLMHQRGGTAYWSESLECGHKLDETPGDVLDQRLKRAARSRRCEKCLRDATRVVCERCQWRGTQQELVGEVTCNCPKCGSTWEVSEVPPLAGGA